MANDVLDTPASHVSKRAQRLLSVVSAVPPVALALQVTLLLHARALSGTWPVQYEVPEVHQLGSVLLSAHSWLAMLATVAVPFSLILGLGLVLHAANRHPLGSLPRPAVLLIGPFAAWLALALCWPTFATFLGWWFD